MEFPERPTIYLDVSLMMGNRRNTGIQRVVRNLARVAPEVCRDFRYNCRLIHCIGQQFYRLRYNLIDQDAQDFVAHVARRGMGRQLMQSAIPRFSSPVQPLEMDRVITLNGTWDHPTWLAAMKQLTLQCHVSSVIHDVIPLMHPQFHTEELRRRFDRWFRGLMETIPNLLATSSTGRQQIQDWLAVHGSQPTPRVSQFRLTSQLASWESTLGLAHSPGETPVRPQLSGFLDQSPVLLMVGTVEPRKNHAQVLEACRQLWDGGWKGRLLILGARGWECDQLESMMAGMPSDRLLRLSDASDEELSYAYRNATALVFPSWTEGFGLPIVEALGVGLPVLASDTEIHREVAGSHAGYFPLADAAELATCLEKHERDGYQTLQIAASTFEPVTDRESFRSLVCDAIVAGREFSATIQNVPPWLKSTAERSRAAA